MTSKKRLTPIRAIRAKCLDCSCWQPKEVRQCPHAECPLYPYRFGHNPKRQGIDSKRQDLEEKHDLNPIKSVNIGILREV